MTETFATAQRMVISGGNFTWHSHGGGGLEEEERLAVKQFSSHISTDAFHDAQARSREVDSRVVEDMVRKWTTYLKDPSRFVESFVVEDVLRDIFMWQRDPPITRFPSMWVNGSNRRQIAFIAQAAAHTLYQRGELSASFFFSKTTGSARVVPSIAYQLAQNIIPARSHILHAIINDPTIFDSSFQVKAQMKKLIVDPLSKASEAHPIPYSNLILIHALEDCDDQDNFQESFLDAFSHALELLKDRFPLKLLILGRHTIHLDDCFAKLARQSMVLRRAIDSDHWLRVEEENYRKAIALRKWEERLTNDEGDSESIQDRERNIAQRERQMERGAKELEQKEMAVRKMEEELKKRERELDQLKLLMGNDYNGRGVSGMWYPESSRLHYPTDPSKPIATSPCSASSSTSFQSRPSTSRSVTTTLSSHSDQSIHAKNGIPIPKSMPSMTPMASRSTTIDGTWSLPTRLSGQPFMDIATHRTYASNLTDRCSTTEHSAQLSLDPLPRLTLRTSSSSSKFSTGDADSYYVAEPVPMDYDPRSVPVQRMNSQGVPTSLPTSPIQAAVDNPECIWKTDENGIVVAGTLEGLVQFLVITIDAQKHSDYRDIFAMACAEVTTPDKLFQIIARRLEGARDEASADARVGQHNAFLVIEHWLKLGYAPLNQNLRWIMKSLCEHAIESKSDAARLYGVANLQKLVDQIMGQSAPPSLLGQGSIPTATLEPQNLAVALSVLEGENYEALRPSDYVLHLTKNRSERVNKFYEMNDKIKVWVIESILQYDDVHRRAEVMTYFIRTAIKCRDLRNFSSAVAIISALYSASIQSLKVTRSSLTRDKQGKLSTLYQIVNHDAEYRGYWDTLNSAPNAEKRGICIPWLKVHLIELQKTLDEHVMTIQEEGQHLINLERYMAFMNRGVELLHYTPPSVEDQHQGEEFRYLLAQLRTVKYSQGTDERQLARSTFLQGLEVVNRRSRKDQMLQLGFPS